MTPAGVPEFPEKALAEAALAYSGGRPGPLRELARSRGIQKPGFRVGTMSASGVADLLAEAAGQSVPDRREILDALRRGLGDPPEDPSGMAPDALRERLRSLKRPEAEARARWIVALLRDPRPEVRALAGEIPAPRAPRKRAAARPAAGAPAKALDDARRRAERAAADLRALREERDRLRREVRDLRRKVGHEEKLRKAAETRAEASEGKRAAAEEALAERTREVARLQGQFQVSDEARAKRERRKLRDRLEEESRGAARTKREYSALLGKIRLLEDQIAEAWSAGKLEQGDFRPADAGAPLAVEPPLETDERPAAEKVRMPADPHHWPGGHEAFRRFLERVARNPYVRRIAPRTFQPVHRHEIASVSDEGYLVALVSGGNYAAQVLIITTATHRGQGEYVRRELAALFTGGGV